MVKAKSGKVQVIFRKIPKLNLDRITDGICQKFTKIEKNSGQNPGFFFCYLNNQVLQWKSSHTGRTFFFFLQNFHQNCLRHSFLCDVIYAIRFKRISNYTNCTKQISNYKKTWKYLSQMYRKMSYCLSFIFAIVHVSCVIYIPMRIKDSWKWA